MSNEVKKQDIPLSKIAEEIIPKRVKKKVIEEVAKKKNYSVQSRHSYFLITINSNKSIRHMMPEEAEKVKEEFVGKVENFLNKYLSQLFILKEGKDSQYFPQYNLENKPLKDRIIYKDPNNPTIDQESRLEVGTKFGFIHTHTILQIKHKLLNINIDFKEAYRLAKIHIYPTIYMNIKKFRNSFQDAVDYINKDYEDQF